MCQVVRTPELVSTLGQRFSTLPATRRMGGTRRYSWGVLECKHSLPGIVRILLLVIVIVYEDLFVSGESSPIALTTFTMKIKTLSSCIVNPK